ncbi:hypothetical protein HMPREF3039_01539 [Akkermansia sp. KLE1798]|nr:hypothetical protein HMPREF3039_01539 [Akkermansia sp. KLE1798]
MNQLYINLEFSVLQSKPNGSVNRNALCNKHKNGLKAYIPCTQIGAFYGICAYFSTKKKPSSSCLLKDDC